MSDLALSFWVGYAFCSGFLTQSVSILLILRRLWKDVTGQVVQFLFPLVFGHCCVHGELFFLARALLFFTCGIHFELCLPVVLFHVVSLLVANYPVLLFTVCCNFLTVFCYT